MLIKQTTYNKKKLRNEIIFLFIKIPVYLLVLYFDFTYDELYVKYRWLGRMSDAILLFLGTNILISVGWIIIIAWYLRRNKLQAYTKDNFVLGINRISSVLNSMTLIISIMIFIGVDVKDMFVSLSIAAAAFAVLSKEYIANMVNGLIIMFSNQISLGDQIRVGEYKGRVLDITLVNVVVQNDDDDIVLIPNSVIFSTMVLNQSKQNIKKMTIEFELDLKYNVSIEVLEKELKSVLSPFASYITANSFSLKILDIKKDLAHYKVQFLIPQPDKETERKMRRLLYNTILSLSGRELGTTEHS